MAGQTRTELVQGKIQRLRTGGREPRPDPELHPSIQRPGNRRGFREFSTSRLSRRNRRHGKSSSPGRRWPSAPSTWPSFIVRRAEGIIVGQNRERDQAQQQLARSEKWPPWASWWPASPTSSIRRSPFLEQRRPGHRLPQLPALPLRVAAHLAENVRRHPASIGTAQSQPLPGLITAVDCDDAEAAWRPACSAMCRTAWSRWNWWKTCGISPRLDRARWWGTDLNRALRFWSSILPKAPFPDASRWSRTLPNCRFSSAILPAQPGFSTSSTMPPRPFPTKATSGCAAGWRAGEIRVDVIDSGGGIPQDVMPHIFDTYFTTKAAGVGTGLACPSPRHRPQPRRRIAGNRDEQPRHHLYGHLP